MAVPTLFARSARQAPAPLAVEDPDVLAAYLEDASAAPRGSAAGLLRPRDEDEAAAFLAATPGLPVLPQGARSSLTGGAVPRGEVVVSLERMTGIGPVFRESGAPTVRVQPGVRLRDLQTRLSESGFYYPPVPTYQDAMIGGTVSTNAGGAATFKYGVTRDWVEALRIVLFNGDVLAVARGEARARPGEHFHVRLTDGTTLEVPVPDWTLPPVKKISAGYFAADPLDVVDLFVGSEGTLGLVTEATLRLVPLPAAVVTGLTFLSGFDHLLALAADLRRAGQQAHVDPSAPAVRAIESLDASSLQLLREHGDAQRLRVNLPPDARAALLFEVELPERPAAAETERILADAAEQRFDTRSPLARMFHILHQHEALDPLECALPGDDARRAMLVDLREAVPRRVHEALRERSRGEGEVSKVGGDLIVPFDQLGAMVAFYEEGFRRRGLDFAIWGHVSDGNLHPNAIPRDARQAGLGREAMLEFAAEATRRGGCPLSEHGVGRSPLKQEILRRFVGPEAIATMRAIKRALDPPGRFAPGVLFPPG